MARVTIILPTYNRAPFLEGAFRSIREQTFTDWVLVVIDDGSTDDTEQMVQEFSRTSSNAVIYVRQANAGAYAARNVGLDRATGDYVAFFDSDDAWMPHHLERCVTALEQHPRVDWVYGACRVIDVATGNTLAPSTFYVAGRPRPFLALKTVKAGNLNIIEDPATLECQLLNGLYCGLQNSVIRRIAFAGVRFDPKSKVVDDQHVVVRLLAEGRRFAYFDDPHVLYRIHDDNSSATTTAKNAEKDVQIFKEMVSGLERLRAEVQLSPRQARALARRLSREYFWHLGYQSLWSAGRDREALEMFRRGLSAWPWNVAEWKTYLLAQAKVSLGVRRPPSPR
jgi:glycosyltransferase involved in cell wall biosynthesis